jgi:hypothetical protein
MARPASLLPLPFCFVLCILLPGATAADSVSSDQQNELYHLTSLT